MQHIQSGFIPGKKGLFKIHKSNLIDQTKKKKKRKDKNYMITSADVGKALDKIQHHLW